MRDVVYSRVEFAVNKNFIQMRNELPFKTGRLAYQSFKLVKTDTGWKLYINLNISPYAVYLDDKPKTHGWWEIACNDFMRRLQLDLNGILRSD